MGPFARWSLLLSLVSILACGDDSAPPDDASVGADVLVTEDAGTDAGGERAPRWEMVADPDVGPLRIWAPLVAPMDGNRTFLFGGTNVDTVVGTTFDRAYIYSWAAGALVATELAVDATEKPDSRYCGCAVHDPDRNVVIVAGGRPLSSPFLPENDTWELDLSTEVWTRWTGTTPPSTLGCMLARQPDGEIVWFGGIAEGGGASDQTYRANGDGWDLITTTAAPSGRYDGVFFPAPDGDGLLLFAGADRATGSGFFADVWRFSEGDWTMLHDGAGVEGRRVAWVRPTDTGFVAVGGFDNMMRSLGDAFEFDLATSAFSPLVADNPPGQRSFAAALEAEDGVGVMLSGYDGEGPVRDIRVLRF